MKTSKTLAFLAAAVVLGGSAVAMAIQPVVSVSEALRAVRVFPNPWRSDAHPDMVITFDRLPAGATVKIFTVAGHAVKTLEAPLGSAEWNRKNESGDLVASGVYLYLVKDNRGGESSGKIAIIR
jgi:hypothetical protein